MRLGDLSRFDQGPWTLEREIKYWRTIFGEFGDQPDFGLRMAAELVERIRAGREGK
jgi:hypothetical protein